MGIFDKLKKDAEDTTQNDQNQQGGQFGGTPSGQDTQTAQNTIRQQGGRSVSGSQAPGSATAGRLSCCHAVFVRSGIFVGPVR